MRRIRRRIWPRSQTWRTVFVAAFILIVIGSSILITILLPVTLTSVYRPLVDNPSDVSTMKDVVSTIQSIVTIIAIVIGGGYVLFKLDAFRDLEPHVNVVHEISHRIMNDTYVHISVTAVLHNSSKVKVEFLEALFSIQRVLPMPNETIEHKHDQVFYHQEATHLQWPVLETLEPTWDYGELVIEPGEVHRETHQFLVKLEEAETILIYTHFLDSRPERLTEGFGWHATTVHDIVSG